MTEHSVDNGINSTIQSILGAAVKEAGKENVYISVRSTVTADSEVLLDFLSIPVNEYDLLIAMIRKLGNSSLGIYKVILDEDSSDR